MLENDLKKLQEISELQALFFRRSPGHFRKSPFHTVILILPFTDRNKPLFIVMHRGTPSLLPNLFLKYPVQNSSNGDLPIHTSNVIYLVLAVDSTFSFLRLSRAGILVCLNFTSVLNTLLAGDK